MSLRGALGALGTLLLAAATACTDAERDGEAPPPERAASPAVARIGERTIAAAELDAPLQMRLYDLDEARYQLRRERLDELLAQELSPREDSQNAAHRLAAARAAGEVEIFLEPPARPRFPVAAEDAPFRGAEDAPVTVVVFCDFESVHCRRIQPTLRRLADDYRGWVRIAHRDHPQRFHRHARRAAVAARCGREQDAFWRVHDALYALDDLGERIDGLARSLGLDEAAFARCLDSPGAAARVDADAARAAALGLGGVPTSFVNGLYLRGPAAERVFRDLIESELAAAGVDVPATPKEAAASVGSELPVALVGTVVNADPTRSFAMLESEIWKATRVLVVGDEVMEGRTLAEVEARRAWLRRPDGGLERLELQPGRRSDPPAELVTSRAPEGEGVLRLSREAVDAALEDRPALERRLSPGRLDLEGKHLLKLGEIEPGGLYDALGLEPGDVIMQVDGVFVHDQYNPLWEALRTRSRLSVTLMRRGLPRTIDVEIE